MQITAANLQIQINGRDIVRDLSFTCAPGTKVAITGPSGSGKTTLLNALGRLLPITSGTLRFDDQDATRWSQPRTRRFWRDSAAFVLQDYGLVDDESVAYNVTLTKPLWRRRAPEPAVLAILDQVGLGDRATSPAVQLSGGEKRRVAIARALYRRSALIFADEPTASLDDDNRSLVQNLLLGPAQQDATVLIATHDATLAQACDQRIHLTRA